MPASDDLLATIALLPAAERLRIADGIWASLNHVDSDAEAAWLTECDARRARLQAGRTRLVDAQAVFRRLRR